MKTGLERELADRKSELKLKEERLDARRQEMVRKQAIVLSGLFFPQLPFYFVFISFPVYFVFISFLFFF
jgi:hypothetical protein